MPDTNTDTSTITDTETSEKQRWRFVVYGYGFWGNGNTYDEALDNAEKHNGFRRKDGHVLVAFTRDVQDVQCSVFGLTWNWTSDGVGDFVEIPMNSWK